MEISKKDAEDSNDQSKLNLLTIAAVAYNLFPENISKNEVEENSHTKQIQTPTLKAEQPQTQCSTIQTHWENEVNLEEEKQKVLEEFQQLYVHKEHNRTPFQLGSQNIIDQQKRQELMPLQQLHFLQNRQLQEDGQSLQKQQPNQNGQSHQNEHPLYNVKSQQSTLNIWEEQKQQALQQFQHLQLYQNKRQMHYTGTENIQDKQEATAGFQELQFRMNKQPQYNTIQTLWEDEIGLEEEKQKALQEFHELYLQNGHNRQKSQNILEQAKGQSLLQLDIQQSKQVQQNGEPVDNGQTQQNIMHSQGSLLMWEEQKQQASQQFQYPQIHDSGHRDSIERHQSTHFQEPQQPDAKQLQVHQNEQLQHNYKMQLLRGSGYAQMQWNRSPQYYMNTENNSDRSPYANIQNQIGDKYYEQNYHPNTSNTTLQYRPQLPNLNGHPSHKEIPSQGIFTNTQATVQMTFKRKLSQQMASLSQQSVLNGQSSQILRALQRPILNIGSSQMAQPPRLLITPQLPFNEHTSQFPRIPITNGSSQLIKLPLTNGPSPRLLRTLELKDEIMPKVLVPHQVPDAGGKRSLAALPLQAPMTNCKKSQVVKPTQMSVKNGQRAYMMPLRQLPLVNRSQMAHQPQMFIPNGRFQQVVGSSQQYQQPLSQGMYFNNNGYHLAKEPEIEPKLKKSRFHNEEQILELEKTFYSCDNPSKVDINKLSINIGLSEKQIKSWFQNRRWKQRRDEENTAFQFHQEKTEQIMNWLSEMKNHVDIETYYEIDETIDEENTQLPDSTQSEEGTGNN